MAHNENEDINKQQIYQPVKQQAKNIDDETASLQSITDRITTDDDDDNESNDHSICEQNKSRGEINGTRCQSAPAGAKLPNINSHITQEPHSDDDHDAEKEKPKQKRSKTWDPNLSDTEAHKMLIQEPLRLFEKFDIEEDGKLNITQFEQIVNALFPLDDDDHKEDKDEIKATKNAFSLMIRDESSPCLNYRENIHDLAEELRQFGDERNKEEFLRICVDIFGNSKRKTVTQFDSTEQNPVVYARNVIKQYTEQRDSGTKHQFQLMKYTAEVLVDWIEKYGILSIEQNEKLKAQNEEILQKKSSIEEKIQYHTKEVQMYHQCKEDIQKEHEKLVKERADFRYKYVELNKDYKDLHDEYKRTQERFDKLQQDLKKSKKQEKKLKKSETECDRLRDVNDSLQRQLEEVSHCNRNWKKTVDRLEREKYESNIANMREKDLFIGPAAATHGQAATVPDSDDDEVDLNDSEHGYALTAHARRFSDESAQSITLYGIHNANRTQPPSTAGVSDTEWHDHVDTNYHEPISMQLSELEERLIKTINQNQPETENKQLREFILEQSENLKTLLQKIQRQFTEMSNKEVVRIMDDVMDQLSQQTNGNRERVKQITNTAKQIQEDMKNINEEFEHDVSKQLKQIQEDLNNLQQSLCVKAMISTEAIESAQDKIQTTQLQTEISNATEFSSLGTNIYSIKKQLNHILDTLDTLKKKDLPHIISEAVQSSQIMTKCLSSHYTDDEDDDDDADGDDEDDDLKLKQQREQIEVESKQTLISVIYQSKCELMEYIDHKLQSKKQMELLEKDQKEETDYEAEHKQDAEAEAEESQLIKSVVGIQKDSISNDIKQQMNALRTMIGLDITQKTRFINEEFKNNMKQIVQNEIKPLQTKQEANKLNDSSLQIFKNEMKQMLQEANKSHMKQMLNELKSELDPLKCNISKTYIYDDNECTVNTKTQIQSNKTLCCTFCTAVAANLFFLIIFFTHKGLYA